MKKRLLLILALLFTSLPTMAAPPPAPVPGPGNGPTVAITVPTAAGEYTSQTDKVTLGGTIATPLPLRQVQWTNDLGGQGAAHPTADHLKGLPVPDTARWLAQGVGNRAWQTAQLELKPGVNTVTVTATDVLGRAGAAVIRISFQTIRPAIFTPATDTIVATTTIGSGGGTLSTTEGPAAIRGATVTFPAGALPGDTTISLGYNSGQLTPNEGQYIGTALVLNASPTSQFDQPVTITVPFDDPTAIPVPYYLDTAGKLHLVQLTDIDPVAHTFSFQTFHASWYTWIINHLPGNGNLIRTDYTPGADGFQITNPDGQTEFFEGGLCFGMAGFSLWYHHNARSSKGPFYPKYMSQVGTDSSSRPLTGQFVIASRAFASISQKYRSFYGPVIEQQARLSHAQRFEAIANAVANSAEPVLIGLGTHESGSTTGHSVVAYQVSRSPGKISVYDPNFPGQTNTITYDTATKTFSPYRGFQTILYIGDGSVAMTEPFQNILDDAEAGFHGTGTADITIDSVTNGQHVTDRTVTLRGTIHSGQLLVTKLTVNVGPSAYTATVDAGGRFSLPINLESGVNKLIFKTEGKDDEGALRTITNNLRTVDYQLILDEPPTLMLVTLTWDTADTDVDLYVTDPTGNTSWYGRRSTPDGGNLDFDITTGYGPEHWTLLRTNTVRYNQPYKVRLHYYSDHRRGPTNYTVTTKLYEGTRHVQTRTFRGNLSVSNPANNTPGSTGPDWRDITILTPQAL